MTVNWTGYWLWLRWYLGEGEFKDFGRKYEPLRPKRHPGNIGRLHGAAWWTRTAAFLAARKKPPFEPVTVDALRFNLWRLPGVWVAWGLENGQFTPATMCVAAMRQGAKWVGVQDSSFNRSRRDTIKEACRASGLKLVVWEWASTGEKSIETVNFWDPDGYAVNVEHRGPWEDLAKDLRDQFFRLPLAVFTNFAGAGALPNGDYSVEEAEWFWGQDFACIAESYMVNEQGPQPNLAPDRLEYTAKNKLGYTHYFPCFGVYRCDRSLYDNASWTSKYPSHSWYLLEYM